MFLRFLKYPGLDIVNISAIVDSEEEYEELPGVVHAVIHMYACIIYVCHTTTTVCTLIELYRYRDELCCEKLDNFSTKFQEIKKELHFENRMLFKGCRIVTSN